MQGVELVNRLINGEPETTIGMNYASTTDGRNAATHERPQTEIKPKPHISEEELGVTRRLASADTACYSYGRAAGSVSARQRSGNLELLMGSCENVSISLRYSAATFRSLRASV